MENSNPAEELRRLEELYAEMSDGQLTELSAHIEDYTEMAQEVFRAEIAKRGLQPPEDVAPADAREAARQAMLAEKARLDSEPQDEREPNRSEESIAKEYDPTAYDLTWVRGVKSAAEARKVLDLLDSIGVKAYLGDDNAEKLEDYHGNYDDLVEVKVLKFQERFAIDYLNRMMPASDTETDSTDDPDSAVVCPKCNSKEIVFVGLDAEPGKPPLPDAKYNWSCDACGHQWKDDGLEKPA